MPQRTCGHSAEIGGYGVATVVMSNHRRDASHAVGVRRSQSPRFWIARLSSVSAASANVLEDVRAGIDGFFNRLGLRRYKRISGVGRLARIQL